MANLNRAEELYRRMYLIRQFELALDGLFKKGLVRGTVHCCVGQEAVAVGITQALGPVDIVTGNHRSHGHYLALTDDVEGLMAEILGRESGIVGGRGGSQHLQNGNFYSNGVQGALVPVATGMALAEKIRGTGSVTVCFMGDGTLGQGVVYESMNFAGLWNLPIIFLVENNRYAMSTPVEQAVSGKIIDRGRAFGLRCHKTESNDVFQILAQAGEIVDQTRNDSSPCFWVLDTYRTCGHSKSDDCCYRNGQEEEEWKAKDPLLLAQSEINEQARLEIEKACVKRIEKAIEKSSSMPQPWPDSVGPEDFAHGA